MLRYLWTKTTALALTLLVLAGTGAGFYVYTLRQWHAAQAAVKANRPEEAQSRLEVCLLVWPRSVEVHLLAARAARLKGDFEGAEAHLNRCLKLEHGATEAIQLEFLLMRVQGGEEDAVAPELLSQYVDNDSPETPVILETLAQAYLHKFRYGPAFYYLNRWIEVAPDSAEAYRGRGWVLEHMNDPQGSMKDYKRAVELDPNLVPARLRLAEMYLDRNEPSEALPHLELLSQQFPERPDVMARLGQCRFAHGQPEVARPLLEAAVEQLPNDSALLISLTKLEVQENHPAKAEQWVRRALKVDPNDTDAEFQLVGILQEQGRWEEARETLEQHRKDTVMWKRVAEILQQEAQHPSTDPDALSELGVLFLRANAHAGMYWLRRALALDPAHQPTHKALAEYYERIGDADKAAFHHRQLKPDGKAGPSEGNPPVPKEPAH
jgi:tetratricopeptide (TPR) repeat protein